MDSDSIDNELLDPCSRKTSGIPDPGEVHIALGSQQGQVKKISISNEFSQIIDSMDICTTNQTVTCMKVHPDGTCIFLGLSDGFLQVWSGQSNWCISKFQAHPEKITCIGISPDGESLFTTSKDLKHWSLWDYSLIKDYGQLKGKFISSIEPVSNGETLFIGSGWDLLHWDANK
jgi:WD40 repeat protein